MMRLLQFNNRVALSPCNRQALQASHPGYVVRLIGGATFASGMLLMAYNTWKTIRIGEKLENLPIAIPAN